MSEIGFISPKMIVIFKASSEKAVLMSDYSWVHKVTSPKKRDHNLFFFPMVLH